MAIYDVSTNEKKAAPSLVAGGTLYADSPIGTILPFGGASAPSGWFLCQGQAVSRTTYSELFAVIGTSFGAGDGSTTFNLPDMTGKTTMGVETDHALGTSEVGALPNITGSARFGGMPGHSYDIMIGEASGAFKASNSGTASPADATTLTGNRTLGIDASESSAIYKDDQSKVDPANVRVNYIIKAKMIAVPADFLAKVDEAVSAAITVKKGIWEGSIVLQKMGDSQTRDSFDIPITFDSPMPDYNYTVIIEFFESKYITVRAASKTASGFHIEGANADNNASSTVTKITWTAIRFPS